MLGLVILFFLPIAISFVGLSAYVKGLVHVGGFALLIGFVLLEIALLYRFGPSRKGARWHWVTPGSLLATLLWLAASVLFSYYVAHLASYDATYGPLGAVAGVMMWFWVSAYLVLAGAELDAELEAAANLPTR
jgi:membrane protein